jgi:hypothetical protein
MTKTIAIASGAAAGGVLCLTALAGFIVFLRWRKRKHGDQPSSSDDSATHMPTRSSAISEYSNIEGRAGAASDSKGQTVVVSEPYGIVSEGGTYGSSGGSTSQSTARIRCDSGITTVQRRVRCRGDKVNAKHTDVAALAELSCV